MGDIKRRSRLNAREARAGIAFLLPSLLGFCLFFAVPFVLVIGYTFTRGIGSTQFVGFQNYLDIFDSYAFRLAAWNTFRFLFVSVSLICVTSFFIALGLRKTKLRLLRPALIIPLVVPVAAVSVVFQIAFADGGVLSGLLGVFGLPAQNIIRSDGAFWVLIIFYLWKNIGYTVILFLAGLNGIPQAYYEEAQICGAGAWQQTRYITIPCVAPMSFFVFIIAIIRSFSTFREAYALAGDYPHESIYMLQHFMNNNFRNLNYQRLSVAALLIFIAIFALVFVLYRFKNRLEAHNK